MMASMTGTKGGTWQTRYFVLKPNVMLYYFESEQSEQPMGCIGATTPRRTTLHRL